MVLIQPHNESEAVVHDANNRKKTHTAATERLQRCKRRGDNDDCRCKRLVGGVL
jgi:hypothetical protein